MGKQGHGTLPQILNWLLGLRHNKALRYGKLKPGQRKNAVWSGVENLLEGSVQKDKR